MTSAVVKFSVGTSFSFLPLSLSREFSSAKEDYKAYHIPHISYMLSRESAAESLSVCCPVNENRFLVPQL